MDLWRNRTLSLDPRAARLEYFNDQWMPRAVSPLHYLVPGLVTDSTADGATAAKNTFKRQFVNRMEQFASKCVVPAGRA